MSCFFSRLVVVLFVFSTFVMVSTAAAENRAGAFTLSPVVGLHFFQEKEDFQDTSFVGIHLGYNITDIWAVEYVATTAKVDEEPAGSGDLDYSTRRLDLLYHFNPAEEFVPYIAAGLGTVRMNFGDGVDDDLIVNLGGGFKYAINDWVALRLDARYSVRHEMTYKPTTHGENYHNLIFTSGITFQSKGSKKIVTNHTEDIGAAVTD